MLRRSTRGAPPNKLETIRASFNKNRPVYDAYVKFCEKWGWDFVDYPEYEFWYMRFYAGNFDLEHDRSKDVRMRTIDELPQEISRKILAAVGVHYRFVLRHVCMSFRFVVDLWPAEYKTIRINAKNDKIHMRIDDKEYIYAKRAPEVLNFPKLATDDLVNLLKHPEQLEQFEVTGPRAMEFVEQLCKKMKSAKIKNLHVENAKLLLCNAKVLKFFQPVTLRTVHFELDKHSEKPMQKEQQVEEINKMRQCLRAEMLTFGKTILKFDSKFQIPKILRRRQVTYDVTELPLELAKRLVKVVIEHRDNYNRCILDEGHPRGYIMHTFHTTPFCRMIGYHWNLVQYWSQEGRRLLSIANNDGEIVIQKLRNR